MNRNIEFAYIVLILKCALCLYTIGIYKHNWHSSVSASRTVEKNSSR